VSLQSLDCVLQRLNIVKHVVKGDGNCLFPIKLDLFLAVLKAMRRSVVS